MVTWPGLRSASHPRFTFPLAPASSAQRMQLHCKESPGGNLASLLSALDSVFYCISLGSPCLFSDLTTLSHLLSLR